MRLGFHTNAFGWAGEKDLLKVASFAKDVGYEFLEVGPTFPLDKDVFLEAESIVPIDGFCYCRNFIDDDEKNGKRERDELYKRMEFASSIGVGRLIISTGISEKLSKTDHGGCNPLMSLDNVIEFLQEALSLAEKYGLELALENCPMERNSATSPFMIRKIFSAIPDKRLTLCYDPSHSVWQFMDIYSPLSEFSSRVKHVHLKDTALYRNKLSDVGIMFNTASDKGWNENQWWRHTIVGDGEIDWKKFLSLLKGRDDISFSVEEEDCNYEGSIERVKEGLLEQKKRIKDYIKEVE